MRTETVEVAMEMALGLALGLALLPHPLGSVEKAAKSESYRSQADEEA